MTTGAPPRWADVRRGIPRWIEATLAAVGLVVLLPVIVVSALAVRLSSPGPVFFRQRRVGQDGRPFELVKFRSMRTNTKAFEVTAAGDPLITVVGRVLRRTKLDEIPSFWNVVRGDMALVGPRPEVPSLVDLSDPLWEEVLAVKPGLTDPVTLALRNEERLLEEAKRRTGDLRAFYGHLQRWKLRSYATYLRRRSAWSDFAVLAQTALAIVGVRAADTPTVTDIESATTSDLASARPT